MVVTSLYAVTDSFCSVPSPLSAVLIQFYAVAFSLCGAFPVICGNVFIICGAYFIIHVVNSLYAVPSPLQDLLPDMANLFYAVLHAVRGLALA